jgi:hypothetical protein
MFQYRSAAELRASHKPALAVESSPTSRAAAAKIEPRRNNLQAIVYAYIAACSAGATDEEIQEGTGMNPSTQRPRRNELVEQGLIVDSGRTRPTRSGRAAVVWVKA